MAWQRRRSGSRGFRGKPVARKQYAWAACDPTTYTQGASELGSPIVTHTDWQRGGGLIFERATLVAVRGCIAVAINSAGAERCWFNIACYDEGETVDATNLATTLVEEDILWTYVVDLRGGDNQPAPSSMSIPVDIRAKRKLTSDTNVLLVSVASGNEFRITPMLRACIQFG